MSILGADDAGPDLGGRPRGRTLRRVAVWVTAFLAFAAIAGGGWYLVRRPAGPLPACATAAPPAPAIRVLNGTGRAGLAANTASVLADRGFRVLGVGNAPALRGASQVRYGRGQVAAARTVARQLPAAAVLSDPRVRGRVDLVLGGGFTRLRSPAELAAVDKAAAAKAARAAGRSPRPSRPSPTCR